MAALSDNLVYITLITLVTVLAIVFFVYLLRKKRFRDAQCAAARLSFRNTVQAVAARVPPVDGYWDNKVIDELPYVSKMLNRAVTELLPFLSFEQQVSLKKEWLYLKSFIAEQLPKELVAAGAMFAGSVAGTRGPKQSFHRGMQSLLKYSDEN